VRPLAHPRCLYGGGGDRPGNVSLLARGGIEPEAALRADRGFDLHHRAVGRQGNQTTIRSSYRLGAFAYPDERAVLTDLTHFPPLLVPEVLHARFEVLLGGLLSAGKNTFSMDWPTNSFTW